MAIKLVTAVPGAGKTLYAMALLEKELKKGRACYTDIEGCSLVGVRDAPDDWRTLEDGAFIVYDEVHRRWAGTGKPGPSGNPITMEMDTHRHRGFDFVLVTQFPTKLHHEVRALVDDHKHLQRIMNSPSATVYTWPVANINPNDRREKDGADSEIWTYPRHLYKFYLSSTVHTGAYKFKIPAKMKFILTFVAIAAVGLIYRLSGSDSMLGHAIGNNTATAPVQQSGFISTSSSSGRLAVNDWMDSGQLPEIMGCVSNATQCLCYSGDGKPLDLDYATCLTAMERPLPLVLGSNKKSKT